MIREKREELFVIIHISRLTLQKRVLFVCTVLKGNSELRKAPPLDV